VEVKGLNKCKIKKIEYKGKMGVKINYVSREEKQSDFKKMGKYIFADMGDLFKKKILEITCLWLNFLPSRTGSCHILLPLGPASIHFVLPSQP
jgi:hypothetical protein